MFKKMTKGQKCRVIVGLVFMAVGTGLIISAYIPK